MARAAMYAEIKNWAATLDDETLATDISIFSSKLQAYISRPVWLCVTHLFNHRTHHHGQVHAMLTAAGAKHNDTGLLLMPKKLFGLTEWRKIAHLVSTALNAVKRVSHLWAISSASLGSKPSHS
jgi:uncharacterized damage-inducible protein DinB